MAQGVTAELKELVDLRRYAHSVSYRPEEKAKQFGTRLSKLRGRGMDFAKVRHYQTGDEIRSMEWRATARTGNPHVKIYQEERERPVVMLVDFSPSMIFGTRIAFKSVIAARLAALLAWTVIKEGDKIGGVFFCATEHSEFIPRTRAMGVLPMLASLSRYTSQTQAEHETQPRMLRDALIRLRHVVKPGSILVLISDFYALDEECEKHLNRLRIHNDILAYPIYDPIELSVPKPQNYAITNGQHDMILDTRLHSVSTAYAHYCQQRVAQLHTLFQRLQIRHVQVTADVDLVQLVRHTFLKGYRG